MSDGVGKGDWLRLGNFFKRGDGELRGRSSRQYIQAISSTFVALGGDAIAEGRITGESFEAGRPAVVSAAKELTAILRQYRGADVDWNASSIWDDAFQCERLIVEVLDAPRLEVELDRRILEAQGLGLALAEFYRGRVRAPKDGGQTLDFEQIEMNRSLLGRLTRDLQWEYSQRDLKRRYAHQAQMRVCFVFLIALALFSLVMFETFKVANIQVAAALEGETATQDVTDPPAPAVEPPETLQ